MVRVKLLDDGIASRLERQHPVGTQVLAGPEGELTAVGIIRAGEIRPVTHHSQRQFPLSRRLRVCLATDAKQILQLTAMIRPETRRRYDRPPRGNGRAGICEL